MPRGRKSQQLLKASPKETPKRRPKTAPDSESVAAPKVTPIKRSVRRPVATPIARPEPASENTVYFLYDLPHYDTPGAPGFKKCHARFYGECLGEFVTERDAKEFLKRNEQYGAFAIAERINGKIGNSWPIEIEEPEEIEGDGAGDLAALDPDDIDDSELLDPRIVKRDIKIARLESKIEERANGHAQNGHNPIVDKLLERFLDERLSSSDPLEAMERDVQRIERLRTLFGRKENPAPAPAPAPVDSKIELLKIAAQSPEIAEIAKDVLGLKSAGDSDPWLDLANKVLDSPQLPQVIQSLGNVASNVFSGIASIFAPKTAQGTPAPQTPQAPPVSQTPQQPQAAQQATPAQTPALPEAGQQQQQQPTPEEIASDPYTAMLTDVITAMAQNAPIDGAIKRVDGFLMLAPQYREVVDELFDQKADTLLNAISGIPGCESIPQLSHAKTWIESFQASFFGEGEEKANEFSNLKEIETP